MIILPPFPPARFAHIRGSAQAKPSTSNLLTIILLTFLFISLTFPARAQGQNTFTDPRDGHQYQSITIGTQIWMAENLAYLSGVNRIATGLFDEECRYVYGYDGISSDSAKRSVNYIEFGVLYNWVAAKSACPAGWHLPGDQEWKDLEIFLGMNERETGIRDWRTSGETGQKLKSSSGWIQGNGTNITGFNVLPAGCRGYAGYESKGYAAYFWTASTMDGDNGWRRGFCSDSPGISRQEDRRYFGASVRCVKNKNLIK